MESAVEQAVEVTPEMIEAGVGKLDSLQEVASSAWLVEEVYRAMEAARRLCDVRGREGAIEITKKMLDAGLDALILNRGDDVLTVTEIAQAILRQLPASTERQQTTRLPAPGFGPRDC